MNVEMLRYKLQELRDEISSLLTSISDPEVPDFDDESPQDPWYPIKDITTDFVRKEKYLADFISDKVKHEEVVERMLTQPRKEPPYTMSGVQHLIKETGQDKDVSRDVSDIKQLRHKTIMEAQWKRHWSKENTKRYSDPPNAQILDDEPEIKSLQLSVDAGAALSRMKHELNQRAMMEEFFTRLPQAIANEQGREFLKSVKKPEDVIEDVLKYNCHVRMDMAKMHSRLIVQSLKKAGFIKC